VHPTFQKADGGGLGWSFKSAAFAAKRGSIDNGHAA
jgi:hypothetical protein